MPDARPSRHGSVIPAGAVWDYGLGGPPPDGVSLKLFVSIRRSMFMNVENIEDIEDAGNTDEPIAPPKGPPEKAARGSRPILIVRRAAALPD